MMTSSMDHLKQVQEKERYQDSNHTTSAVQHIMLYDSAFGRPCLLLHEPTATLICCQNRAFLCVGKVNDIKLDGESVEHVGHDILAKETVRTYIIPSNRPYSHNF